MIRPGISVGRVLGALGFAAMCVLPSMAQPGAPRPTLIIFPLDRPENIDSTVADTITSGIRNRLEKAGRYEFMTFSTRSALVQRAIQSGSISRDQAEGPFDGPTGAAIARTLGLDYALTGTVDDASVDPTSNTANVTVTAQLLTAKDGRALQTAAASGTATEAGAAADILMRRAADSAAEKLATQLPSATTGAATPGAVTQMETPPTPPTAVSGTTGATGTTGTTGTTGATGATVTPGTMGPMPTDRIPVERTHKKKSNNMLLIGGLALIGVLIATSGGGGGNGGGGGGGDNPPPFPF